MEATAKKQTQKSLDQIIWEASQPILPPGVNKDAFIGKIAAMVNQRGYNFLQVGDTAFLMNLVDPQKKISEFTMFSKEPLESIVERYKTGFDLARKMGIKGVVVRTKSPRMLQALKSVDPKASVTQGETSPGPKMGPAYVVTFNLAAPSVNP